MKKTILIVIALLLVLSLAGCTALSVHNLNATKLFTKAEAPVAQTEPATEETTEPATKTKILVSPTSKKTIGLEAAKAAAFKHAKVKASNVRDLDVDLNKDNGSKQYEINFEAGDYDYEYEIDAYSGKVIRHEKERND